MGGVGGRARALVREADSGVRAEVSEVARPLASRILSRAACTVSGEEAYQLDMVIGVRGSVDSFDNLARDHARLLDRIVIRENRRALSDAAPTAHTCRAEASPPSGDMGLAPAPPAPERAGSAPRGVLK